MARLAIRTHWFWRALGCACASVIVTLMWGGGQHALALVALVAFFVIYSDRSNRL